MTNRANHMILADDLGDEIVLPALPRRIVSLVPSLTETVIALGTGDRLVGITRYCVHPTPAVSSIPKVGGTKGFSFVKIDSLRPDLVLANKEENRKRHIERLRQRYPVFVTYPRTVGESLETVTHMGLLTGRAEKAREIVEAAASLRPPEGPSAGRRFRTACMIWRDPWMAAGPDTYVSDLLGTFGFDNVFSASGSRYPETTLDAVAGLKPDVVILPSEPYAFGEADRREFEGFLSQAGRPARIVLIEGSLLTWFGFRTLEGLRALQAVRRSLTQDE